jgi:hypothetical protein
MCVCLQVPVVSSVVTEPSAVAQGEPFQIVVTLQTALTSGSVNVVSSPAGIRCLDAPKLIQGLTVIRLSCIAPGLAVAQTAAQQVEREQVQAVPQSTAGSTDEAAHTSQMQQEAHGEGGVAASASRATDSEARVMKIRSPVTNRYTLTATVTADRTASATTTIKVCLQHHTLVLCLFDIGR